MIYLDSCYIAKFYLAEPDSPAVIAFAQRQSGICCLTLGKVEVTAVFHRKFREGIVDLAGFHLLCDQFESDCANGLWHWMPMNDALTGRCSQRFRALPSSVFLRAADALHLTCATEEGFAAIHTSDRHMVLAAPAFGLRAVTL